ncbi:hypothetical protein [Flavobacterium sp. W21_SRS_FM6]|uniref:hypothetical protein n=1 Tax=Flavobacterium sp. W21_SRS_FM6 TaxID=3240268 RepID=UPI003F9048B4
MREENPVKKLHCSLSCRELSVSGVNEPSNLAIEDLAIQKKLEVLALVENRGNASEAWRLSGDSLDTFTAI